MTRIAASLGISPAIIEHVHEVVQRHRAIRSSVYHEYHGHRLRIDPSVFSPFIAPSGEISLTFAALPIFDGARVLDVGCGAGIQASLIGASGAHRVVGVDINPAAIENARANASAIGCTNVEFRVGDLFSTIDESEVFDIIFADLPLMSEKPNDMLERAFFDPELDCSRRFLEALPWILSRGNGVAYLCTSNLGLVDLEKSTRLVSDEVLTRKTADDIELALVRITLA